MQNAYNYASLPEMNPTHRNYTTYHNYYSPSGMKPTEPYTKMPTISQTAPIYDLPNENPTIHTSTANIHKRSWIMTPSDTAWCSAINGICFLDLESSRSSPKLWKNHSSELFMEVIKKCRDILLTGFHFMFITVLGLGKIYVDGFSDYAQYFTNWAWSLYGIYYGFILCGHLFSWSLLRTTLLIFTMAVNGICWSVLSVVFVIIYNNPDIILSMMTGMGGNNPAGLVLVLNCAYHPIAVILFLSFAILHTHEITSVFRDFKHYMDSIHIVKSIFYSVCIIYSPILVMGLYMMNYDPHKVYGYSVLGTHTVMIVIVICTLVNGVTFWTLAYSKTDSEVYHHPACSLCGHAHPSRNFFQGLSLIRWFSYVRRKETEDQEESKIIEEEIMASQTKRHIS